MYKEADQDRKWLEAEIIELKGFKSRCHSAENQAEELLDRIIETEAENLESKLNVARAEINFLRNTIAELAAALRSTVKAQD